MRIEIIPLALKKIKLRGIAQKLIEETIKNPDQTTTGYSGRHVAQKIFTINKKKMLLRVIYETENRGYVVITAYLTSQVDRYWK